MKDKWVVLLVVVVVDVVGSKILYRRVLRPRAFIFSLISLSCCRSNSLSSTRCFYLCVCVYVGG